MSGIPAGAGQLLGKRLGKFDILALLALGGTAEIYLARIGGAAGFEKYVVVKCLHDHLADDAEFVKMFLDEARLAAHLDHSNIVQTMELGEHDGRYYMVMEFLAGLSLAMIVRRAAERMPSARIPVPLVLNMLAQASAGLHYAHEKAMNGKALNIVHRDISPQNLVISFEGVVKLVDFGIAKAELRETRTRSGTIKGKFAYMSPEQCVANNVDRRTDVFALGVIGHELLVGRRLFKRASPYETYQAVMECNVQPPSAIDPQIDPALDPVIMGAITKDKADRYPSAEAFGDALLRYLHHRGVGSSPGDVSRFFDAHFGQELEEHSGRMRELIAGRDLSVDTGVSWGGGMDDDRLHADSSDPSDPSGSSASSGDLPAFHRQSGGSLSLLLDDLGTGSRGEADDEMPAEPTRIESNPLERINELERLAGHGPSAPPDGATRIVPFASPDGATRIVPSSAVPVPQPPPGVVAAAGPGSPAGPAGTGRPASPSSGRFPDLANLPTMIGESDGARTPHPSLANALDGLPAQLPAHARTQIAAIPVAASGTPAAGAPSGARDAGPGSHGGGLPGMPPPVGSSGYAQDYPKMNAQLSAQIATGATVFPSDLPRGAAPPPGPMSALPGMPPPGGPGPMGLQSTLPMGAQGTLPPGEQGPPGAPAPMPAGMPGSFGARGSEPAGMLEGHPQLARPPDGSLLDAQRAAGMMSPVGQQYPGNVDWNALAAGRARAVPPWLLAVLFIGAIGVALAITIVIARILR